MKTFTPRNIAIFMIAAVAMALFAVAGLSNTTLTSASSHREAPLISKDQSADTTDTYAFIPKGKTDRIALIANWIPFENPEGGPNYYEFDDQVLYEIYVDNNGDAVADVTYTLRSTTTVRDPLNTFLYNTGPITSIHDQTWNRPQRYTLTETRNGNSTNLLTGVMAPPVNIGSKSTPNYQALVNEATYTAPGGINVYAGPADDPFWVDLQVFDLLTLRGQAAPVGYGTGNNTPVDSLSGMNVHTLALEIPINRLTRGEETVLGVWAGSRRTGMGVFEANGAPVQVSRLGMPLVNEVVIPMGLKDTFNSIKPSADLGVYGLLQESVENPEVGTLLCALYGVPMPGDANNDCNTEYKRVGDPANLANARSGRGDIFDIFLTGFKLANPFTIVTADGPVELPAGFNVNQPANVVPAEMIRINTAVSGNLCSPTPSRLGVLGGDACGYPNGRRLIDDTVEISLLAVAGAAYEVLDDRDASFTFNPAFINVLDDGLDANDKPFSNSFPYLALAHSGQEHVHQNPGTAPAAPQPGNGGNGGGGSAPAGQKVSARLQNAAGADRGYVTFEATDDGGTQFIVDVQRADIGTGDFDVVLFDMPDCSGDANVMTQIKVFNGNGYKSWRTSTDLNSLTSGNGSGVGIVNTGGTLLCASFSP